MFRYYTRQALLSLPPARHDHIINGGTFVTFTDDAAIIESVAAFNDPSVFMRGHELHCTRNHPVDLGDFWKFHRQRTGE